MSGNKSPCLTTYRPSSPITCWPGASGYSAAAAGNAASAEIRTIAAAHQRDHWRATSQPRPLPCDRAQIIVLPNYERQRQLRRACRENERAARRRLLHQSALIHLTRAGQGLIGRRQGLIGRRLRALGDGAR